MTDRTIVVRLKAELSDFRRGMEEARRESGKTSAAFDADGNKIETTTGRMVRSAHINREAWNTAGVALTAFGVAGIAALGMSAKAALDWETAWTGVLKTVDGSSSELLQLEEELRALALTRPADHLQIAAVAEAAGQLGVATKDVARFTAVMIDLGETTNLTSDEAATSLAQFMNVMQTASRDVDRLGATVVALGNNGASTERDIVSMAQRLAGAAKIVKLTEGETLGLANALASVGIEAEAGGSAVSNIMIDISKAVSEGGRELETWARVAGLSADDFATKWKYAPAEALALVVEGLGDMNTAGEDVFNTLEELGQSDVRVTRALLNMANSGDLLRNSLDLGNEAWKDNNALVEEAAKRYDTTEAKIAIAKNSINDAAIEIGEHLLPIIARGSEALAEFAQWFASLPESTQKVILGLGGTASVLALAGGGFLLFTPRVLDTINALDTLGVISGPRAIASLKGFIRYGAPAAAAAAAVYVGIDTLNRSLVGTGPAIGATTAELQKLADGQQAFADVDWNGNQNGLVSFLTGVKVELENYEDTLAAAVYSQKSFWEQFKEGPNSFNKSEQQQALAFFDSVDTALSNMVQSGNADGAAEALESLNIPLEYQAKLLPDYTDALAGASAEQETTAKTTAEATKETYSFNDALKESIDLRREASGAVLDEWDALTQYAEAVSSATDALYDNDGVLQEANRTLDANTEAGRANRDALANIVDSTWDWIDAGVAAGESQTELGERMAESREAFILTATQLGLTREEAEDLADQFGLIPAQVTTIVTADTSGARAALNSLRAMYDDIQWAKYSAARTGYATGGAIFGPGTSTSDSIPIMASNGEFMQPASSHRHYGTQAMEAMRRRDTPALLQALSARGMATGGSVTHAYYAPAPSSVSLGAVTARLDPSDIASLGDYIVKSAHAIARGEVAPVRDVLESLPLTVRSM